MRTEAAGHARLWGVKLFNKNTSPENADNAASTAGAAGAASSAGAQSVRGREKKNHPTPKRRQAQAANLRPIVPADRKAARKAARAAADEEWERRRAAVAAGDERYMDARDKGKIRRYVRDYIDARYSLGELFMPLAILMMLISFTIGYMGTTGSQIALYTLLSMYGLFLLAIIDAVVAWRRCRSRLIARFGAEAVSEQRRLGWYAFTRCFTFRRMRVPAPQVARGQFPGQD